MAINFEKMKARLAVVQNKTAALWKPTAGKHVIRIVPNKDNLEDPFTELFFHYNIGGKHYLSPRSFGRPDPIVELADKLQSTGNSDDWKTGLKYQPKMKTFVRILVRGKEEEGVKLWGFGKEVYKTLLSIVDPEGYGDITDLKNGRDLNVEIIWLKLPFKSLASSPNISILQSIQLKK